MYVIKIIIINAELSDAHGAPYQVTYQVTFPAFTKYEWALKEHVALDRTSWSLKSFL